MIQCLNYANEHPEDSCLKTTFNVELFLITAMKKPFTSVPEKLFLNKFGRFPQKHMQWIFFVRTLTKVWNFHKYDLVLWSFQQII